MKKTLLILGACVAMLSSYAQQEEHSQGVNLVNSNVSNVNQLTINDIGVDEGIIWPGGFGISVWTTGQGGEPAFKFESTGTYPFEFSGANVNVDHSIKFGLENDKGIIGSDGAHMRLSMGGEGQTPYINFLSSDAPAAGYDARIILKNDLLEMTGAPVYIGAWTGSSQFTTYATQGYKLGVDGKVVCEELKVQLSSKWADYVFAPEYKMMTLSETESYINKNKHLPNIPSATEVAEEGISLGEMSKLQMEKIEELTLHVIAINKEKEELEKRIARLEALLTK